MYSYVKLVNESFNSLYIFCSIRASINNALNMKGWESLESFDSKETSLESMVTIAKILEVADKNSQKFRTREMIKSRKCIRWRIESMLIFKHTMQVCLLMIKYYIYY